MNIFIFIFMSHELLTNVPSNHICERMWEKGPYRAKTKLKIRVDTLVRVNPVKTVFFVMTKNYLFPVFLQI